MSRTLVWRLYPEAGSSLFVRVLIHPTKKAMREHWRRTDGGPFNGGTWGRRIAYCRVVMRWMGRRRSELRRDRCIAEVHCYRARVGTGIVTHELFHATMAWARRVGIPLGELTNKPVNQLEERLAYAHGDMCREFVVRAYEVGLYE